MDSSPPGKPVVLFGVSDFAQIAAVYLAADSPHRVAAYAVHERFIEAPELLGLPVVPFETLADTHPPESYAMFIAVGFSKMNQRRADIYQECKRRGYEFITYVSSKAALSPHVSVGENCFIFEHNVLQPFVEIGHNVVIWSGNHIGHHSKIEDNCFVASHAVISGRVTVGNGSFIGVNATIADGVKVGSGTLIGAGALILRDTAERGVYPGTATEPAKVTSDRLRGF